MSSFGDHTLPFPADWDDVGIEEDNGAPPISKIPSVLPKNSAPVDASREKAKPDAAKVYVQTTIATNKSVLTFCNACNFVYNSVLKDDVKEHEKVHRACVQGQQPLQMEPGILQEDWKDSKGIRHQIFCVSVASSRKWQKYAMQALEDSFNVLDGPEFDEDDLFSYAHESYAGAKVPRYKIYFHTIDNEFAALALAEYITKAGEWYNGPICYYYHGPVDPKQPPRGTQEWVSLDNTYGVTVSIDRICVNPRFQRQGLATNLVNMVRNTFVGQPLGKRDVAFSRPTSSGAGFATKYCKGVNWQAVDAESNTYQLPFVVNPADARYHVVRGRLVENDRVSKHTTL